MSDSQTPSVDETIDRIIHLNNPSIPLHTILLGRSDKSRCTSRGKIHDPLYSCSRIDAGKHPSPSESILDSQSVKSAAGVQKQVGFDAGKLIKGRK